MTDEHLPSPPWQRVPDRSRSRRKQPITREAIVATALRLLDRDGLDELSMRKVADELGTGAASLYWHVGSKEGLLDLVFEEVIGEHHVPDPEPERWAEQLKEIAHEMRAVILRHRDIVRISIGRIPMGPNAMRFSERVLAVLRAGGVPDDLAVLGHHLLFSIVNGFTLDESRARRDDGRGAAARGGQDGARLHRGASVRPVPEHGGRGRRLRDHRQ